jgi:glycosyltransferase involved in cell wall biosynthesis
LKQDIAIVIPCYRVSDSIAGVVRSALEHADLVICVDDACPEHSGRLVQSEFKDDRVKVLFNERNLGVGGAVKAGYREALATGSAVVVKLDGDGQMDPSLIPLLAQPILAGESDFCKGNRFHEVHYLRGMPALRVLGNSVLSMFTKVSSGYWQIFDPTNGYTAIGAHVLAALPLDRISDGYFFESDMLFRLNVSRAVVTDVPMSAHYGDEVSSLRIGRIIGPFLLGNFRNLGKRIFYNYFLRDFNIASLQLVLGSILFLFGFVTGIVAWSRSIETGFPASAGTVMLAGLPVILGFQLLLSFLNFDIQNQPRQPLGRVWRREGWR